MRTRPRGGSSPLTRGKQSIASQRRRTPRLIPAHAGKTCSQRCGCGRRRAHPRSRGENLAGRRGAGRVTAHPRSRGENKKVPLGASGQAGSSPLTRGKLPAVRLDSRPSRLIPAHSGKTKPTAWCRPACTAHPRSRGENELPQTRNVLSGGSSPLTRGKPAGPPRRRAGRRLIPAHAGKTAGAGAGIAARSGSSPLTRGKHREVDKRGDATRLIPAHAGKTSHSVATPVLMPAHPRSRGENGSEPPEG